MTTHEFRAAQPWSPNVSDEPLCGLCQLPEGDPTHYPVLCLGPGECTGWGCGWRKPCGTCECRIFEAYFDRPPFVECPPNHAGAR